jgi:hypothetical protein
MQENESESKRELSEIDDTDIVYQQPGEVKLLDRKTSPNFAKMLDESELEMNDSETENQFIENQYLFGTRTPDVRKQSQ